MVVIGLFALRINLICHYTVFITSTYVFYFRKKHTKKAIIHYNTYLSAY